jgi:hypothetical protein
MSGNTRGRLKERFEGVHRNFDWAIEHCRQSLILVKDFKPELAEAIKGLAEGIQTLDELAQGIYVKL